MKPVSVAAETVLKGIREHDLPPGGVWPLPEGTPCPFTLAAHIPQGAGVEGTPTPVS